MPEAAQPSLFGAESRNQFDVPVLTRENVIDLFTTNLELTNKVARLEAENRRLEAELECRP